MQLNESEKQATADALLAMAEIGDTRELAPAADETRSGPSIENPNVPVTADALSAILGFGPTHAGVQVNEHTAMSYIAVFSAIRVLAESVAMLPLILYRGDEDSNDRERATDHPLYWLLRREPNPEMTSPVFKETLQGHLAGWGNGYARIIADNAGRTTALIPLLPDRTHAERIAGQLQYVYRGNGGDQRFWPEEIIHIAGLGFNGLKGYSPIGHARQSIGLGIAAETFGATFFGNGAQVGGVLTHPGRLNGTARSNMRESWNRMHQGPASANQVAILEEGVTYTRIGIPPEDAQFLETRKFQVTEIARLFRIPPHMLGDLSSSTNNNIEQQALEFLVYTLTPWLEKWEAELTRKLLPLGSGLFVRFDVRKLLRTNLTAKQGWYACGRQWGFYSANDVRQEEDMPPIKGGDVYLSPVNMTTSERLIQNPPPPAGQGENNPNPANPELEDKTDGGEARDRDRDLARVAGIRCVFEDAFARMLRKEMNAASRGRADEKFYGEHRAHVAESLRPGVRAIGAILNLPTDAGSIAAMEEILSQVAEKRHHLGEAGVEAAGAAIAAEEALALTDQLISIVKGKL